METFTTPVNRTDLRYVAGDTISCAEMNKFVLLKHFQNDDKIK